MAQIKHPLYHVWQSMRDRCNNPKSRSFQRYGGRGISVCERWSTRITGFQNFLADMGPRADGLSLDRINNDLGYEPSNCRWATRKEQQLNRHNTRYVVVGGARFKSYELAAMVGVKPDTILSRAETGHDMAGILKRGRHVHTAGLALGGKANGERQRAKTHCPNGHLYVPDNVYLSVEGWRRCRQCVLAKESRRRARHRA